MLSEAAEEEPNEQICVIATFITEVLQDKGDTDTEDKSEFDTLVFELLKLYDDKFRSQNAYMVDINLHVLIKDISELSN